MIRSVTMCGLGCLLASQVCLNANAAQSSAEERRIDAVQNALLQLPYYGVFDFLTFTYDRGQVTVDGYAYHPTLGADAARALKQVSGVDSVEVKVRSLPPSPFDDEIRWRVFHAIYTNRYPIHIVVERGRVRLLGVVDTEVDKTVAGMAARQVGGTFAVENELVIDRR